MATQILSQSPSAVSTLKPYAAAGHEPTYQIRLKTFRVCEGVPPMPGQEPMSSPESATRIAHAIWNSSFDLDRESVAVFTVNSRNRIIGFRAWHGTVDHSVVYPREVLEACIRLGASGFILAHNHPSGDLTPSTQDLNLTKTLETAARAMGIRFLDHLILDLSDVDHAYSFQRNGLLP